MVVVLNVPVVYAALRINLRSVEFDVLTWFYFFTVVIGYYVLPLLVIITLLFPFLFRLPRLAVIATGALTTIFVYYLFIDSCAYNIAKIHIDSFWLEWVINDAAAFGLSANTLRTALVVLLVLIATEIGIVALAHRVKKPAWLKLAIPLLAVLSFGVSQTIHAIAYETNVIGITSITPHLPAYYPITSHRNAVKYGGLLPIDQKEHAAGSNEGQATIAYPLHEMEFSVLPDTKLPNVLVVFLESWRYDMLSDDVTPNIFSLARRSTVCRNHFCSGNSTVAGVTGFFFGLHPTYWSSIKANIDVIRNPVLIDFLHDNNYAFGIYAKSNFKRHKIKDAIFQDIEVHESFRGTTVVEEDADMTQQLISFLRKRTESQAPFMAFAFYKSNHAPYRYPVTDTVFRPAADLNLMFANDDTDPTQYLNDYRNSTRYVDGLVGEILEELDSLGFMSNTIIIVTTDHGEEFNDNRANYWGHGSNFTQYQTRVPLVFYAPDRDPLQVERVTCHIDVVPTLLDEFLGCQNPVQDYSNGLSLFEDCKEIRPVVIGSYTNHAFVIENNVYEVYPVFTKAYKLDDIRSEVTAPPHQALKTLAEGISRFLQQN
jgi:membrane-anchored protein YejM (alkaline phosphatase superfamily)